MRNLTKSLAVISLLAPVSGQPLGIGDLKLHSALNQRLNAEINLLLSAGESSDDIQVRLAPPEKFDEAGIPWNYFLPKIKFETVVQANGSVIVKLTSNEALKDPFLDFLVEVSWAEGNLYREFTVLVDPPAVYEEPVAVAIEQKSESAKAVQVDRQEVAPAAVVEKAVRAPSVVTQIATADSYGPTTRSDTLWSIAEQLKPSGNISTEQMVMAIYQANPKAFYKKNVNALMSGSMLDVPDDEVVVRLSKTQAAKLFKQQQRAWSGAVEKPAEAQPETKIAKEEVVAKPEPAPEKAVVVQPEASAEQQPPASQLKLEAPVEAEVAEQVVVTPEQEKATEDTVKTEVESETTTEDVASVEEKTAGPQQAEMDALQARLQKMEQQLKEMQELLAMKDEQLAALQRKQQLQAEKPQPAKPEVSEAVAVKPTQAKPEVKPKPKPLKLKVQPAPAEEPEGMFDDVYYPVVGGLGVLMLGGLGWIWWRKRKAEEETDAESMFASSSEIRLPDSEVSVAPVEDVSSYDVGTVGESSFLSEFTPSDFDAFDSEQDEVDPVSEADVYLAYGRYQQAEELMRQAIADEPAREDCKLKLLEIFYANENKEAFEDYARELAQAGMRDNHSFWSKVLEMGNEIIPDSSVLSADENESVASQERTEEQSGSDEPEAVTAEHEHEQARFDLDSFVEPTPPDESEQAEEKAESNDDLDLDLDFDLSEFETPEEKTSKQQGEEKTDWTAPAEDLESIEFDLSAFSEPEAEEIKASEEDAVADEDIESFEFDFDTEAEQEKLGSEPELELDLKDETDLDNFDFSEMNQPEEVEDDASEQHSLEESGEDDFDFSFDFDESEGEGGLEGVADLTDMDEFETKVDLARAYIDMGDNEAALSIAKEVLEKGNDQQKKDAQAILDQLSQ